MISDESLEEGRDSRGGEGARQSWRVQQLDDKDGWRTARSFVCAKMFTAYAMRGEGGMRPLCNPRREVWRPHACPTSTWLSAPRLELSDGSIRTCTAPSACHCKSASSVSIRSALPASWRHGQTSTHSWMRSSFRHPRQLSYGLHEAWHICAQLEAHMLSLLKRRCSHRHYLPLCQSLSYYRPPSPRLPALQMATIRLRMANPTSSSLLSQISSTTQSTEGGGVAAGVRAATRHVTLRAMPAERA